MMEIPFVEGGRSKKGCDCWGLVRIFYKDILNIELPSFENIYLNENRNYSETSDNIEREKIKEKRDRFKQVNNPKYGDIILISLMGRPIHIGVALDNKTMIHTRKSSGVVIEDFSGVKWNKRIEGYYRLIQN
jgi:cell wall-associated NlpC family hydrolase